MTRARRLATLVVAAVAVIPALSACSGSDSNQPQSSQSPSAPSTGNAKHGPLFPECGGITDQIMAEQTRVTGLVKTAANSVGCQWLAGGGILGPHFSFTWYRGSPIGRERKTEELSRTSVEDINIEGHSGFIALGTDPPWGQPVRDRHPVQRRLHRVVGQLRREALPAGVRGGQRSSPASRL